MRDTPVVDRDHLVRLTMSYKTSQGLGAFIDLDIENLSTDVAAYAVFELVRMLEHRDRGSA